jgi:hypothetical protein
LYTKKDFLKRVYYLANLPESMTHKRIKTKHSVLATPEKQNILQPQLFGVYYNKDCKSHRIDIYTLQHMYKHSEDHQLLQHILGNLICNEKHELISCCMNPNITYQKCAHFRHKYALQSTGCSHRTKYGPTGESKEHYEAKYAVLESRPLLQQTCAMTGCKAISLSIQLSNSSWRGEVECRIPGAKYIADVGFKMDIPSTGGVKWFFVEIKHTHATGPVKSDFIDSHKSWDWAEITPAQVVYGVMHRKPILFETKTLTYCPHHEKHGPQLENLLGSIQNTETVIVNFKQRYSVSQIQIAVKQLPECEKSLNKEENALSELQSEISGLIALMYHDGGVVDPMPFRKQIFMISRYLSAIELRLRYNMPYGRNEFYNNRILSKSQLKQLRTSAANQQMIHNDPHGKLHSGKYTKGFHVLLAMEVYPHAVHCWSGDVAGCRHTLSLEHNRLITRARLVWTMFKCRLRVLPEVCDDTILNDLLKHANSVWRVYSQAVQKKENSV